MVIRNDGVRVCAVCVSVAPVASIFRFSRVQIPTNVCINMDFHFRIRCRWMVNDTRHDSESAVVSTKRVSRAMCKLIIIVCHFDFIRFDFRQQFRLNTRYTCIVRALIRVIVSHRKSRISAKVEQQINKCQNKNQFRKYGGVSVSVCVTEYGEQHITHIQWEEKECGYECAQ